MAQRIAVLASIGLLLAAVALVINDSFYGALHVRPQDAGIGPADVMARGVVYLGIAVGLAALVDTAALLTIRWLLSPAPGWIAWAVASLAAAAITFLVARAAFDGLGRFADRSTLNVAGCFLIALALSGLLALFNSGAFPEGGALDSLLAVALLVLLVLGAAPALLLAREAGHDLASRAKAGRSVSPGPFDPMELRATPACLLPPAGSPDVGPARLWMEIGQSAAGVVLFDPDTDRGIVVAPARLGALGVANDVCRVPGEGAPVETGTPQEDAALARLYRPFLRFDRREPWRPLDVERFAGETFSDEPTHHHACPSARPCDEDLRSTAQLTPAVATIDIRGQRDDGSDYLGPGTAACRPAAPLLECPDTNGAIYYHVARRDRRVYVDYWWFLRYDQVPAPTGPHGTCGGTPVRSFEHEGDWEGITVVSRFGEPERVDYVAYAAHNSRFTYPRGVTEWAGTTPSLRQRPVVYVACGTHAAYPRPCGGPRGCRETSGGCDAPPCGAPVSHIAEAPFDGHDPWIRDDDAACFTATPCLLPLPTAASGAAVPWASWPGHWGRNPAAPRSPAFQTRFRRPWAITPSDRTSFGRKATAGDAPPTARAGRG